MNIEQAIEEMGKGHRVRLSDWLGYWFMIPLKEGEAPVTERRSGMVDIWDACRIRVFTRDGDILDCPNIDRYKDRDDWVVVRETGWPFDAALRFLKSGKRVERAGWNGKGMWICWVGRGSFSIGEEVYPSTAYLQIKSVNDTVTPWLPSQTDILANDWQIVNA